MISVVIPTYNNAIKIQDAINSLLKQNIPNLEIIVIDDSPNNKTKTAVKSLGSASIKYYKNNHNIGSTQSRKKGLKLCSHDYIGFLDDDDIVLNNNLSQKISLIKSGNYDFVFCNYIVNNLVDNTIIKKQLKKYERDFQKNILLSPGPFLQCCLFNKNFILNAMDDFDRKAEPSEDWDFFISISKKSLKTKHLNVWGFQWNFSQNSQSYNYRNEMLALKYITNKHFKYMESQSKNSLSLQYRKIGSMLYYLQDYSQAKQYFKGAFGIHGISLKNIILNIVQYCPNKVYHLLMTKYVKKII